MTSTASIQPTAPKPPRRYPSVRAGFPEGPQLDPALPVHWLLDRRSMAPEYPRPLPRDEAFARLRDLLSSRDAWDPWVARLAVFAVRGGPGKVNGAGMVPRGLPRRELVDPVLAAWEVRSRRERLSWCARDLATKAGLNPSVICVVERGGGCRVDTLHLIRGVLLRVELARGLRGPDDT